jgi:hypothetical protein
LRVPEGYQALHAQAAAGCAAFDPSAALALALAARPTAERLAHRPLILALAKNALAPVPGLSERLPP